MILGLIPARGGSKRLPRKNLKLLCGRPLIAWPILEAQKSGYIDKLAVTTEDDEIIDIATDYGVSIIRRPLHMATSTSLVYSAIKHALEQVPEATAVCLIQPTSPLLRVTDIDRTIDEYQRTGKPAMTVARGQSVANGAVYIGSREWLLAGGNWDDGSPKWVEMEPRRSIDINTAEEFAEAERLMKLREAAHEHNGMERFA